MREIAFTVPGVPIGKGRPRVVGLPVCGRPGLYQGFRMYTPKETEQYEQAVARAFSSAVNVARVGLKFPHLGPVELWLWAAFPVTPSRPQWWKRKAVAGGIKPTARPDADNILKIVCDALTGDGLAWRDDAQVITATVLKVYAERPRLEVKLWFVDPPTRE